MQASNKNHFIRSGFIISLMTSLSRILGLLRDIIIARYFGSDSHSDAFFVAFKIPNFLRRLFAEGAFSQAFVPILANSSAQQSEQETKILINHIGAYLLQILFVITLIAIIIAPLIILIFAFGFYQIPEKFNLATQMLRITFPYLLLVSLTAFFGAILNTYHQFAAPAFAPVLLNISMIACAIFLSPYLSEPIIALAWGVLIGGITQCLFQIPFLKRINRLPKFKFTWHKGQHPAIKTLKQKMLPAMFGVSVVQINLLIDTVIASFLVSGSISWLYYADRLLELPLALIGISLATLSLAKLSNAFAIKDDKNYEKILSKAISIAIILGLPATIALILLAEPIMNTLFTYGQFTHDHATQSANALVAYGFGLLALIFVKILAPAFYARSDIKTPVKIGVIALVVNVIFNLILVNYFAHVGLAMATSLSAIVNASLLYYALHQQKIYQLSAVIIKLSLHSVVATIIMVSLIVYFNLHTINYELIEVWQRIRLLSLTTILGIATYFVSLFMFGTLKIIKKL